MSFRYFAYGSNLWVPQMLRRCPTARPAGVGTLVGWQVVYDKPSQDGSAKLNIRPAPDSDVQGVIYEIDDEDRESLDAAEPRYRPVEVDVGGPALTYIYEEETTTARPYDWYVEMVARGCRQHGIDPAGRVVRTDPDPLATGVRPCGPEDLPEMEAVVAECLTEDNGRYSIHPGEFSWWMYHEDPRPPGRFTWWMVGSDVVMNLDETQPEINLFARRGADRFDAIEWAQQRRLAGKGEIAWIADTDTEMIEFARAVGFEPTHTDRAYRWDLREKPIPQPSLPEGWELRHVIGEEEADARRKASHAAFQSTMDPVAHLGRYLRFMRAPTYRSDRDLVAVSPEGEIAAFMIWWGDDSGIAQIEPFGTDPKYQRRGVGTALIHFGLSRMVEEGMTVARVITDEPRDATAFYEAVGFTDVGAVRWWGSPAGASGRP